MTGYFFRSEYFNNFRIQRPYTFDFEQMFMWNVLLSSKDRSLFIKRPYVFESDQELFCNLSKDRILCGLYLVCERPYTLKKTVYKDRVLSKITRFQLLTVDVHHFWCFWICWSETEKKFSCVSNHLFRWWSLSQLNFVSSSLIGWFGQTDLNWGHNTTILWINFWFQSLCLKRF